jgi:hypothetical protein
MNPSLSQWRIPTNSVSASQYRRRGACLRSFAMVRRTIVYSRQCEKEAHRIKGSYDSNHRTAQ